MGGDLRWEPAALHRAAEALFVGGATPPCQWFYYGGDAGSEGDDEDLSDAGPPSSSPSPPAPQTASSDTSYPGSTAAAASSAAARSAAPGGRLPWGDHEEGEGPEVDARSYGSSSDTSSAPGTAPLERSTSSFTTNCSSLTQSPAAGGSRNSTPPTSLGPTPPHGTTPQHGHQSGATDGAASAGVGGGGFAGSVQSGGTGGNLFAAPGVRPPLVPWLPGLSLQQQQAHLAAFANLSPLQQQQHLASLHLSNPAWAAALAADVFGNSIPNSNSNTVFAKNSSGAHAGNNNLSAAYTPVSNPHLQHFQQQLLSKRGSGQLPAAFISAALDLPLGAAGLRRTSSAAAPSAADMHGGNSGYPGFGVPPLAAKQQGMGIANGVAAGSSKRTSSSSGHGGNGGYFMCNVLHLPPGLHGPCTGADMLRRFKRGVVGVHTELAGAAPPPPLPAAAADKPPSAPGLMPLPPALLQPPPPSSSAFERLSQVLEWVDTGLPYQPHKHKPRYSKLLSLYPETGANGHWYLLEPPPAQSSMNGRLHKGSCAGGAALSVNGLQIYGPVSWKEVVARCELDEHFARHGSVVGVMGPPPAAALPASSSPSAASLPCLRASMESLGKLVQWSEAKHSPPELLQPRIVYGCSRNSPRFPPPPPASNLHTASSAGPGGIPSGATGADCEGGGNGSGSGNGKPPMAVAPGPGVHHGHSRSLGGEATFQGGGDYWLPPPHPGFTDPRASERSSLSSGGAAAMVHGPVMMPHHKPLPCGGVNSRHVPRQLPGPGGMYPYGRNALLPNGLYPPVPQYVNGNARLSNHSPRMQTPHSGSAGGYEYSSSSQQAHGTSSGGGDGGAGDVIVLPATLSPERPRPSPWQTSPPQQQFPTTAYRPAATFVTAGTAASGGNVATSGLVRTTSIGGTTKPLDISSALSAKPFVPAAAAAAAAKAAAVSAANAKPPVQAAVPVTAAATKPAPGVTAVVPAAAAASAAPAAIDEEVAVPATTVAADAAAAKLAVPARPAVLSSQLRVLRQQQLSSQQQSRSGSPVPVRCSSLATSPRSLSSVINATHTLKASSDGAHEDVFGEDTDGFEAEGTSVGAMPLPLRARSFSCLSGHGVNGVGWLSGGSGGKIGGRSSIGGVEVSGRSLDWDASMRVGGTSPFANSMTTASSSGQVEGDVACVVGSPGSATVGMGLLCAPRVPAATATRRLSASFVLHRPKHHSAGGAAAGGTGASPAAAASAAHTKAGGLRLHAAARSYLQTRLQQAATAAVAASPGSSLASVATAVMTAAAGLGASLSLADATSLAVSASAAAAAGKAGKPAAAAAAAAAAAGTLPLPSLSLTAPAETVSLTPAPQPSAPLPEAAEMEVVAAGATLSLSASSPAALSAAAITAAVGSGAADAAAGTAQEDGVERPSPTACASDAISSSNAPDVTMPARDMKLGGPRPFGSQKSLSYMGSMEQAEALGVPWATDGAVVVTRGVSHVAGSMPGGGGADGTGAGATLTGAAGAAPPAAIAASPESPRCSLSDPGTSIAHQLQPDSPTRSSGSATSSVSFISAFAAGPSQSPFGLGESEPVFFGGGMIPHGSFHPAAAADAAAAGGSASSLSRSGSVGCAQAALSNADCAANTAGSSFPLPVKSVATTANTTAVADDAVAAAGAASLRPPMPPAAAAAAGGGYMQAAANRLTRRATDAGIALALVQPITATTTTLSSGNCGLGGDSKSNGNGLLFKTRRTTSDVPPLAGLLDGGAGSCNGMMSVLPLDELVLGGSVRGGGGSRVSRAASWGFALPDVL